MRRDPTVAATPSSGWVSRRGKWNSCGGESVTADRMAMSSIVSMTWIDIFDTRVSGHTCETVMSMTSRSTYLDERRDLQHQCVPTVTISPTGIYSRWMVFFAFVGCRHRIRRGKRDMVSGRPDGSQRSPENQGCCQRHAGKKAGAHSEDLPSYLCVERRRTLQRHCRFARRLSVGSSGGVCPHYSSRYVAGGM